MSKSIVIDPASPVSDGYVDPADRAFRQTVDGPKRKDDQSVPGKKNSLWAAPTLECGGGFKEKSVEDMIFDLFKLTDSDQISVSRFINVLKSHGIRKDDPRLKDMMEMFREQDEGRVLKGEHDEHGLGNLKLDRETFKRCISPSLVMVVRTLQNQLVIPDWHVLCGHIEQLYERCKIMKDGKPAQYIPQLAKMNPNFWAVSICTVDGQRYSWGDYKAPFCLQSVSKAFNYATAISERGADFVHKHVGQEPSGRFFNDISLDHNSLPHNPMINAGAIAICSLLRPERTMAERFEFILDTYQKFGGHEFTGFSNPTFLSERDTADRNFALAYYLREYKVFPQEAKLNETLDLYLQLCSVEVTSETLAVMGSTLANGGICPLTGERVVSNHATRDTLSLMHSCGMYDYSGQFAFRVGLPAKSGVSGAMVVVIPNQMGIALWAPPIDQLGNSCKGLMFCKELVNLFNFHNYDSILNADSQKIDPRKKLAEKSAEKVVHVLFAAKSGDLNAMKQYCMQGVDMELQDYDGRTALHIAASEGHLNVLKFLRESVKVNPDPKDRWNRNPLDDAYGFGHAECAKYLEDWFKERGIKFDKKVLNGNAD